MPDHSVKINRAFTQSQIGKFPRARAEALSLIPGSLLPWISSSSLALLLDALDQSHRNGRTVEAQSILAEGAIYNPQQNKLREIAR